MGVEAGHGTLEREKAATPSSSTVSATRERRAVLAMETPRMAWTPVGCMKPYC